MKKLIKRFALILAAAMLMMTVVGLVPAEAKADVVWEPDNSFYKKHYNEVDPVNKEYVVNSPTGSLKAYKKPGDKKAIQVYENGDSLYIEGKYSDKENRVWGFTANEEWINMKYMDPVYDSYQFFLDYDDQCVKESGDIPFDREADGGYLWCYDFPGSEDCLNVYDFLTDDTPFMYVEVFVDPYGNKWGRTNWIPYWESDSTWVCLTDPSATYEEIYPEGQNFASYEFVDRSKVADGKTSDADGEQYSEDEDYDDAVPATGFMLKLIIIVVLGIVIATGVITVVIVVNTKKKQS